MRNRSLKISTGKRLLPNLLVALAALFLPSAKTTASVFASTVYANSPTNTRSLVSPWRWTDESWTSDDAPYRKIRSMIDLMKSSDSLVASTLEQYYVLHREEPENSVALFQWAYASFQATQLNPPIPQQIVVAPGAFESLPSPNAYNYDRLRFLVWAHEAPDAHLQTLGERLLHQEPGDNAVKYYLIQCYKPWHSVLERQKALALADDLIHSEPKRPGVYSALAGVYYSSWMVNHQKGDAIKAISGYKQYLALAPKNYVWRQIAARIIQYIRKRM